MNKINQKSGPALRSSKGFIQHHSSSGTRSGAGFTLIELLVVIGIIAVLAAVVIVAINPARQFAQARNSQRQANVTAILDAVGQNLADNRGTFTCADGVIPTTATNMSSAAADYDIAPCIVPNYLSTMVVDPSTGTFTSVTNYDSQYSIQRDATTGRVTISAPDAELNVTISQTR